MTGDAYKENEGSLDALFKETPYFCDNFEWFFSSQGGWKNSHSKEFDELFQKCIFSRKETESSDISCIHKEHFTWAYENLIIDEWTILLGIESVDHYLKVCTPLNLVGEDTFKYIQTNGGILLLWIDGWWECFSSFKNFEVAFNTCLEKKPISSGKWIKNDQVINPFK